jgi:putative addiction module killer protein
LKAQVKNRLARVMVGNYGDCEYLRNGVHELRIHYGAGYRIYFSELERTIVLLLVGGSKRTQKKDIKTAAAYLENFQERLL